MTEDEYKECDGCGVETSDENSWNCENCGSPVCLDCSGEHKKECHETDICVGCGVKIPDGSYKCDRCFNIYEGKC